MKTNYTVKTIKTGLAIFAIALSSTFAAAQVATVYEDAYLDPPASTIFPDGAIQVTSAEIALEGVTFKIQTTITPGGNGKWIESNGNLIFGVGTGGADDRGTIFEGDEQESATINGLTVVDFNAGATSYTVANISDLHFHSINFRNAQHDTDHPKVTVNGDAPGTYDLGRLLQDFYVAFGVQFANLDLVSPTVFTVGDDSTVTSITLENGSTEATDVYNFSTLVASYTFTTGTLSTEDFAKNDNAFYVFPTVVENVFSVSKAFKTLKIIDITGKTVKTFNTSDALEVSGLHSGLYIVRLESEIGNIAASKLIVK